MRTGKPEHLKTFDYVGFHRYFLTFCTFQRHRAFAAADRVALVSTHVLRASADERFAVIAYCFMPDHVHLLVEGQSENSDGRRFLARAKQFSGLHYQRTFGARLWQRYGYEHVLRSEEATLSVARCILENPVRAGLVQTVMDYPFIGSIAYTVGEVLDAVQLQPTWTCARRSG